MDNYSGNRHDITLPDETETDQVNSVGLAKPKQLSLFKFSPIPAEIRPFRERSEKSKGFAGETFTESELRMWGFDVFKTDGLMPWDLGIDINGRVIKFQVKTISSLAEKLVFEFARNSNHRDGPRKVPYRSTDFDISVCVSLAHHKVIFQPGVHRRIYLYAEQFLREGSSFASLLMSLKEIGIQIGDLK